MPIIASYITARIVDREFRKQEERERRKTQNVALAELYQPLNNQIGLFWRWYERSVKKMPENRPNDFREVIEDDSIEEIRLLDFNAPQSVEGRRRIIDESVDRMNTFAEDVDGVLTRYGESIDSELAYHLSFLKRSPLFRRLSNIQNMSADSSFGQAEGSRLEHPLSDYNYLPVLAYDGYKDFQNHLESLLYVSQFYGNNDLPELEYFDISDRWGNTKPGPGSARISIEIDQLPDYREGTPEGVDELISTKLLEALQNSNYKSK